MLGGTLTYSGTSQGAINIGTYTITPDGLTSSNYNISYADGSLAINALPWIFDLYHTLEQHSGAITNAGNSYTGLFTQKPNFEIDPSVFDDNQ